MKKFIVGLICLLAANTFAYKYTVNNTLTDGDINVVFDAVARPSDYYLRVPANSARTLDTGGYCVRGVTVIGLGGALQGKTSGLKSVPGIVCKGYTINVGPIKRTLNNPVLGTQQEVVADFDIAIR